MMMPNDIPTVPALRAAARAVEIAAIWAAMDACEWRVLPAARMLDMPPSSLRAVIASCPELAAELERLGSSRGRPAAA